jgi:ABC-2 type transport system ATP-binding protein
LTGAEFLELVSQLRGMTRDQFETRRQFLVDCFDLGSVSNRPVATFSKGQRQRLVLIAALLHDPDVLILDEPLSGLDANGARTVKDLVQGLAASGKTILFCTHTLEVVERLCSRVIILNFGRVVLDEPIAKVLGRSPDGTLETVFTSLTRTGIGVPVPATEQ